MASSQPTLDDVWRLLEETSRQFQATDRKFQESERRFQDTERLIKDMSRETDRKIKEMTASIGKLGNRLGDFIEDAVRPSAVRLFQARGIEVHEVHQNVSAQRGGEGLEIDLLVVNSTDVVAIECKSHLRPEDIRDHLERLQKLKRLLPAYAGKRVMGAVAAMVIPDDAALHAYRHGLFVIGQSGEAMEIRNPADFAPMLW
jgi:hypothetical protein